MAFGPGVVAAPMGSVPRSVADVWFALSVRQKLDAGSPAGGATVDSAPVVR